MTATQVVFTLDQQIEQLADKAGVSEAQLKTVYLRGVNDFFSSADAQGSATMYGLARVLRFIRERGTVIDSDLIAADNTVTSADHGIELSAGMFFSPDIVYASGKNVAALFEPGVVTCMTMADDLLLVSGELGSLRWEYALNTSTGAHSLDVQ